MKYQYLLMFSHVLHFKIGTSIGHYQKVVSRTPCRRVKSSIEAIEKHATCLESFFILVWFRQTLSLGNLKLNLEEFQVSVPDVPKMLIRKISEWNPQRCLSRR